MSILNRTLVRQTSFWLVVAILLHLLLLIGFSLVLFFPDQKEKPPGMYIPSYVRQEKAAPVPHAATEAPPQKSEPTSKNGIEKPVKTTVAEEAEVRNVKQYKVMNISKNTEPIHLVGDNKVVKPLLILLGKALGAHLAYPRIAVDLNIHGIALVGFTLHPDGTITGAQLVRTSNAGVLDDEAVAAVLAMSPVKNVGAYLTQPKYMVVGIIFG